MAYLFYFSPLNIYHYDQRLVHIILPLLTVKKNPFVYDLANLERNLSLLMKIQVISNMFCYINIQAGPLRKLIGANQMQTDSPLTRVNCYRK